MSNKVVFLELHKTGGTHIGAWLNKLIGGEQRGKHNRLTSDLNDRFIMGSVRNPWDWYVSLWAYGCRGQGSVKHQLCRKFSPVYCWDELPREMDKHYLSASQWYRQFLGEFNKPIEFWVDCYSDIENPDKFRQWLAVLLSSERVFDMGGGFAHSPISTRFGLMTYRYIRLFTDFKVDIYNNRALANLDGINRAMEDFGLVDWVIRNESLELDLLEGLSLAGIELRDQQKADLQAGSTSKINSSKHKGSAFYYDQQSLDIVAQREAYIINRYGYLPPSLSF